MNPVIYEEDFAVMQSLCRANMWCKYDYRNKNTENEIYSEYTEVFCIFGLLLFMIMIEYSNKHYEAT